MCVCVRVVCDTFAAKEAVEWSFLNRDTQPGTIETRTSHCGVIIFDLIIAVQNDSIEMRIYCSDSSQLLFGEK